MMEGGLNDKEWSLERILWVQLSAAGILARLTFFLITTRHTVIVSSDTIR